MKRFLGYTRVSTVRQGERGVSLQEQRDAIARYAERHGLEIVQWFEERQTAAKRGRRIFTQMLKLLKQGKADGLIVHKIDRSTRNLKDWAELGDLIDRGIKVHFANESLDLDTRGGRLSADIQAVVAADYIRNLREETRKGLWGRLKQGLYPWPAPNGYLDQGGGKPKTPDPAKAPLVAKAFELYATGRYTLDTLVEDLWRRGLRNRNGGKITRNQLSVLLNNPFYMGLIRLRRSGETYPGGHQPLISKSLFDQVQAILNGRTNGRGPRHEFLFRRLLTCKHCGRSLTGERQKGHVYYRCHTKRCPTMCVREETVETAVLSALAQLQFSEEESAYLRQQVSRLKADWETARETELRAVTLNLDRLRDRLGRLTDAYIDRLIEKDIFEERKKALLMQKKGLEEQLEKLQDDKGSTPDRLAEMFELAGSAYLSYKTASAEEKRELLQIVSSNRLVDEKNVVVTLKIPFREIANRSQNTNGWARWDSNPQAFWAADFKSAA